MLPKNFIRWYRQRRMSPAERALMRSLSRKAGRSIEDCGITILDLKNYDGEYSTEVSDHVILSGSSTHEFQLNILLLLMLVGSYDNKNRGANVHQLIARIFSNVSNTTVLGDLNSGFPLSAYTILVNTPDAMHRYIDVTVIWRIFRKAKIDTVNLLQSIISCTKTT
ncbi:hypothetical protein PHYBLDRAFT_147936 [Phycomyces blakesleeanus NRRL 1555(-)]|uniref:Uncharacterized protein n=1 Tax=Phycomyces blakesleeanus (strain ATCC 8743b / DSM 1359 / FGSC 10004 / NBRC 33097 / NRRL 1555) TaxID=763407 RepID=A0A167LZX5_PHYB8|nr:hypothetical protein PHYBLDRAFT_147936 [Phycomyces blakesleeanus NRRL 1555(-)]OAD71439.1 hypothetical protein PHYBLDRAFT_147936 [Phycomyces blakesleeanus NRRL 1555(-)]|eukprot:XP_018289479.1 hypothetical protein PHYBLDRAFT_147936 [Phycomyces blakesleeanus NRRL 1555(-)]